MNPDEFAQSIKTQYPQYKNVDNLTLAKTIIEKYPQYASKVNFGSQSKNDLLNNPITRGIQNIFPGKQVGEAIGTLGGLASEKIKGLFGGKDNSKYYDTSAPSPLQVAGDIAQGALTVAAPGIGTGKSVVGRIGANALLGAGLGGTGAIAQGENIGGVAKSTAIGGLAAGAISGTIEGISALAKNLPKWFAQAALPKMKNAPEFKYIPNQAGGYTATPQESAAQYAIENTKGLNVKSMLKNSNSSIENYSGQVDNILSHPEYEQNFGHGVQPFNDVVSNFPNAQLNKNKIVSIIKQLAPEHKDIIDNVANGSANLAEQNTLRSTLDSKIYIKFPEKTLTFSQDVGKTFADSLRSSVQTTAPETAPIFNKLTKEFTLNKALNRAVNKKTVAGDIIAGTVGFAKGGLAGATEAILIERGLRSPTVIMNAAKVLSGAGKIVAPVAKTAFQAGKAPLIKKITDSQK